MDGKLTMDDAAFRLGVSKRMLWTLVSDGVFESQRLDQCSYINEQDILDFANALEVQYLIENPSVPVYDKGSRTKDGRLFMRAKEAACVLGISRQALCRLIADFQIAAFRIGRCLLLRPDDVEAYRRWKAGEKP